MRICFISDTHCQLDSIILPEADFLIHSGDALTNGNITELIQFNNHLESIKGKYQRILYTPGNHDIIFEKDSALAKNILMNAETYIHEEFILEKDGLKLKGFASPYSPKFFDWAFMYPKSEASRIWSSIPENTEILVTHSPAYGRLDEIPKNYLRYNEFDINVGCRELRKVIDKLNPLIHACGHIHHSYGIVKHSKTQFINAAICTERYSPLNKPVLVEVNNQKIVSIL